jgi:alpha-L-rhamnosidase
MIITNLRTEYFPQPLGIEVLQPRFSWQLESERRGARQVAYQVLAWQNANTDLWDSGRIESDQSVHVVYAGTPLSSRQRVWWRVRVWDETGDAHESTLSWFEMGLLNRSDWQANWIQAPLAGGPQTTSPAPFMRREFALDKPVKQARLYATALGLYECYFNGQRVGDDYFSPGWTEYKKRVQYTVYDVTEQLQSGQNAWGAILGDGWYAGNVEWRGRQLYGDRPRFFAQLEVTFEDGSTQIVVTDNSWKTAYGPILESDMLMGESYDARREFPDWNKVGFDDDAWWPVQPATLESEPLLSARRGPVVRVMEEITPVAEPQTINKWPSNDYIFDMGQNMVGTIRLKVSGERGTTLKIRYAETLEGGPAATEGPIYTTNLRTARQTDVYTLKGEGEEIFEPKFTFHGFRFVEINGLSEAPAREALTGLVLHSDTPQTGDFGCSDPLLNQLQKNIDWGQRGNFLDIPTDCPQRDERLGWTGDAQVFIRTAAWNRDVASFFTKWAQDVKDAQTAAGAIPPIIPNTGIMGEGDGGPAWADAAIICPWTTYLCYGDTHILDENYDVFVNYLEYLQKTSRDGIRCFPGCDNYAGFGDWLALDGSGKLDGGTPKEIIGTAFFAHSAYLLSRIAQVLGKNEDAQKYFAIFENARAAFQKRYVTPTGIVASGTQTAYLLALHFDLLPPELRETAARELVRDIESRGWHLSTGFVGSPYINHVLTQTGHEDAAFKLLHQTTWPSWLYAVTQGATTIWERWDGWTHDKGFQDVSMNSFNHYAYGAIGAWLYQKVAGIDIDEAQPGYKHIIFQLHPGDLTSAWAYLDSVYGRIKSDWIKSESTFEWEIVVPPNTSATVYLPTTPQSTLSESDAPLESVEGVQVQRREENVVVLAVQPGTYRFVVAEALAI